MLDKIIEEEKAKARGLQETLDTLTGQIKGLEQSQKELQDQIEETKENANLKAQPQELTEAFEKYLAKEKVYRAEIMKLKEMNSKLAKKNEQLSDIQEIEGSISQAQYFKTLNKYKEQNVKLKNELAKKMGQVKALREEKLGNGESSISVSMEKYKLKQEEVIKLDSDLRKTQKSVDFLYQFVLSRCEDLSSIDKSKD